jgi:hypothetical protein
MKRFTRKIISAMKILPEKSGDLQQPIDLPESKQSSLDTFYQRMLDRDIYLHVSEVSVAMVGVCLTGVSILGVEQDVSTFDTYVDDLLAIDSFVFLTAYLLSYWVVRVMTRSDRNVRRLGNIANAIFLVGMILMAIVSACVVLQGDYLK